MQDEVEAGGLGGDRAARGDFGWRGGGGGGEGVVDDLGNPLDSLNEAPDGVYKGRRFREIPDHGEREAGERAANLLGVIGPCRKRAAPIRKSADSERQIRHKSFPPLLRVPVHLVPYGADLAHECAQCEQLTWGEQLVPRIEAVACDSHAKRVLAWSRLRWHPERHIGVQRIELFPVHLRRPDVLLRRRPVLLAELPVHHHGRHPRSQPPRSSLHPQLGHPRDRPAA